MIPAEIIARKRDGHSLTDEQIRTFVQQFSNGQIPDYQMSALAMAIFFRGMSRDETLALTRHMLASGKRLTWPDDGIARVDKHSTGGIGDKVSLVLAPLLASCGLQVPMISGRGLGPTGGTLDKLESIPGFRTQLSIDEIQQVTSDVGCVIAGATAELAPADRQLYALRDVTATVESIPLITSSILSKKLAASLDTLVLDVKFGSGAFMSTLEQATELAQSLVDVCDRMGTKSTALLTDMNQPLGHMIGNAIEVDESINTLAGNGPVDLLEVTMALGAEVLLMQDLASSHQDAVATLQNKLDTGAAMERFEKMVAAQSGDLSAKRMVAPAHDVLATSGGFVHAIDARELGMIVVELGGGRRRKSDEIDFSVGIECLVQVGSHIEAKQPVFRVFGSNEQFDRVHQRLLDSMRVEQSPTAPLTLIRDRVSNVA